MSILAKEDQIIANLAAINTKLDALATAVGSITEVDTSALKAELDAINTKLGDDVATTPTTPAS